MNIYEYKKLAKKNLSILLAVLMAIPTIMYSISIGMEDVKADTPPLEVGDKLIERFPINSGSAFVSYIYQVVLGKSGSSAWNEYELTDVDIGKITAHINISIGSTGTVDLTGIEYFTNLERLTCAKSTGSGDMTFVDEIDLSKNTALKSVTLTSGGFSADASSLKKLILPETTTLTQVSANNCQLTELDVSKNTGLTSLSLIRSPITKLDLSNNTALTTLNVSNTGITELDLSNNTNLTTLNASNAKLKSLDLTGKTFASSSTNISGQTPDFEYEKIGNNEYKIFDIPLDGRVSNLMINDTTYHGSLTSDIIVEEVPTKISYVYNTNASGSYGTALDVTSASVTEKTFSSISVSSIRKKTYIEGEKFDPTGLELTLKYDDNTTRQVSYDDNKDDFIFSPDLNTALKASDNKVTITYLENSVDQIITVRSYINTIVSSADGSVSLQGTILSGSSLNVENIDAADSSYITLLEDMGDNRDVILCADVSILNGSYKEGIDMSIVFNIDPSYNGRTAVIKHMLSDGTIETFIIKVANGSVKMTISELSPFMIAIEEESTPPIEDDNNEQDPSTDPDDNNQDNNNNNNNDYQDNGTSNTGGNASEQSQDDSTAYAAQYATGDNTEAIKIVLILINIASGLTLAYCIFYRRKEELE